MLRVAWQGDGATLDVFLPARGIHTLPVLLGRETALRVTKAMMISFYPIVFGLVLAGVVGWPVLISFAAIPRLVRVLKTYDEPKPERPPAGYRLWPLWYVSLAFYHNRLAGGLFVLGLLIDVVV